MELWGLQIPDVVPYFLAILGLLLMWQFHDILVEAGRIDAMDFWVLSGIRMFIYATPCDAIACKSCRNMHGMLYLPGYAASGTFKGELPTCANPIGCRCLLLGLYGAWPEAERVRKQLKWNRGKLQVTDDYVEALINAGRNRRAGFTADRISLILMEAMQMEKTDTKAAINRYRFVVEEAEDRRDLPFVVPAYLRLSDLLEKVGDEHEAHEVVSNFLQKYTRKQSKKTRKLKIRRWERYRPTESQLAVMSTRRTRLEARLG